MQRTAIVNLKRRPDAIAKGAGAHRPPHEVGQPFVIGRHGTREEVIALYRAEFWRRIRAGEVSLEELAALHGKTLACYWCAPLPCPRELWDEGGVLGAVSQAFRILGESATPDGFQLADEREPMLWGFFNMLDAQVCRLDRSVDRLTPQMRDLERAQDGTEINDREFDLVTARARNLGDRRDAFEKMRAAAAEHYRTETGDT